jgi:hypothetical protein
MSHVDEGLLHAYLDGALTEGDAERIAIEAHLALCADCGVRLRDARRVKDRAGEVLRAVAPAATPPMPDFAEVVARHRARQGAGAADGSGARAEPRPGRGGPWRAMPLAWAASLVLAGSAGWIARALMVPDLASEARDPAATQRAAPESFAGPAEPDAAAGAATGTRAAVAGYAVRGGETAPPQDVARTKAEPPPAVADASVAADRTPAAAPPPEAVAREAPAARAEAGPPLRAIAPAGAAERTAVAGEVGDTALFVPLLLAELADAEAAGAWRSITAAEAEALLGRPAARLPDTAVDAVQHAGGAARAVVRVRQRLPAGDTIEIVQRPAAAVAAAGTPAPRDDQAADAGARANVPGGRGMAGRELDGLVVLVLAPSVELARELAARLR